MTKNIYDLAGNAGEWTNELFFSSLCIYRGSNHNESGMEGTVTYRDFNHSNYSSEDIGFRPRLYIK